MFPNMSSPYSPYNNGPAQPPQSGSGYRMSTGNFRPQPTYGYQPVREAPHTPTNPATLGNVGLSMVIGSLLLITIAAYITSTALADWIVLVGPDNIDRSAIPASVIEEIGIWAWIYNITGFTGFAGWVVSIVAIATRRGRTAGIWGTVVGVVGLILPGLAFLMPMMGAVAATS